MIVIEVGIQKFVTRSAYVSRATFQYHVNIKKLALFWLQVFGATDETTDERIFVLSVIGGYTEHFAKVSTIAECKDTLQSWIFDIDTQILTINWGADFNPLYSPMEYLRSFGMCDTSAIYVDDIAFLPVVTSAPNIKQTQDLIGYDKLAYNTGSIPFTNCSGVMDFVRSMSLFNNDVALSWLDYDGRSEYTRDELTPLAWYLLENISAGKEKGSISLRDVRASWSKKIPSHLFSIEEYPYIDDSLIDKAIPLLFGDKVVDVYCTNGTTTSGNVTYRVAEAITELYHVYKEVDGVVTEITPVSTTLDTGEFSVYASDGRSSDNTPIDLYVSACGLVDEGETYATPLGVIKYIEENYNSANFTESFFDVDEITEELSGLESVSIYIAEQVEIYEFIRQLQEGSSNRFRYDINAEGLRTALLDNLERDSSIFVSKEEILENNEMAIYTDKDTIAATIKINYNKNERTGSYTTAIDTSKESAVAQNARERPEIEFNTFLQTRSVATARALLEAERLGQIRRFTDVTLRGIKYMAVRIYDIITVELLDDAREWAGTWTCQILSIAPDTDKEQNKVKLLLVERVEDIDENEILKIGDDGSIKIAEDDTLKVGA